MLVKQHNVNARKRTFLMMAILILVIVENINLIITADLGISTV
jgi:hypothetical protein